MVQDIIDQQDREIERLRDALYKLIEAADDSDGVQYGTLGTSFVRDIARAALVQDRPSELDRALAYCDELRAELAELRDLFFTVEEHNKKIIGQYHALREAAGKVTCAACIGKGTTFTWVDYQDIPCPDCADLKRLLTNN